MCACYLDAHLLAMRVFSPNRWLILTLFFSTAGLSTAADYTLQTAEKPPPKEIGGSIGAVLQSKAVQLLSGEKPALEIWFRQEIPLKSKPASANDALGAVPETALIGVVVVAEKGMQDYKGNDIQTGTYTARFGLQPQDGDHLGTADYNTFLVLIPADSDKELNGIDKFKPMVKASGKATSSGHPVVLSLRPPSGEAAAPSLTEPATDHKAIRLKLPGKVSGAGDKSDILFDLVYQGKGHT